MKYGLGIMPMYSPDGGSAGGVEANGAGTDNSKGDNSGKNAADDNKDGNGEKNNDNENIERLINARVEKAMEKANKDKSELEKQLDKLRKEKLTAEEVRRLEDEKRAKDLAEREAALKEKENRYYAVSAIKKAGLDDGSDTALKVVDLVMGEDESNIDKKIASLKELVNKIVESKVNEKFKAAGRNPNGGVSNDDGEKDDNSSKNAVAEFLGKARAEQTKRSKEVLDFYLK